MPRRNREQNLKRNETRRNNSKRNRKAVFCLNHLKNTQPEIYKQSIELYEYMNHIYPNKHNLTKTMLYQKIMQNRNVPLSTSIRQNLEVIPKLEIPLMSIRDQVKEIPQQKHQSVVTTITTQQPTVPSEELEALILDLQQEPDIQSFFNEIDVDSHESRPKTLEEEIDDIINAEFQALDIELQNLLDC